MVGFSISCEIACDACQYFVDRESEEFRMFLKKVRKWP